MQSVAVKTKNTSKQGQKNIVLLILHIAGEILLFVFLSLLLKWMNPTANIPYYRQGPQFCMVLGTVIIMLLITGLLPHFFKSFLYGFGQTDCADRNIYTKCLLSVKTAILTSLISGLRATTVSVMDILSRSDVEKHVGLFLSVASTGFLYGIIIAILLMPLYIRLKAKTL